MRYTTQLLLPTATPRDRAAVAIIVAGLVMFAIGLTPLAHQPAAPAMHARVVDDRPGVVIIWTATPGPTASPAPTATSAPMPEPVVIVQTVVEVAGPVYYAVQSAPQEEEQLPEQPPEPTAEAAPTPTETPDPDVAAWKARFVDPPRCSSMIGYVPGSPCYTP